MTCLASAEILMGRIIHKYLKDYHKEEDEMYPVRLQGVKPGPVRGNYSEAGFDRVKRKLSNTLNFLKLE